MVLATPPPPPPARRRKLPLHDHCPTDHHNHNRSASHLTPGIKGYGYHCECCIPGVLCPPLLLPPAALVVVGGLVQCTWPCFTIDDV